MSDAAQQPQEVAPLTAARAAAAHQLWRQAVHMLRPLAASGDSQALQLLSSVLCAAGRPNEAALHLTSAVSRDSSLSGTTQQAVSCTPVFQACSESVYAAQQQNRTEHAVLNLHDLSRSCMIVMCVNTLVRLYTSPSDLSLLLMSAYLAR